MITVRCEKCGVRYPAGTEHKCDKRAVVEKATETIQELRSEGKLWKAGERVDSLVPGEPCPCCGRRVPLTAAEKQRRYRERKKAE